LGGEVYTGAGDDLGWRVGPGLLVRSRAVGGATDSTAAQGGSAILRRRGGQHSLGGRGSASAHEPRPGRMHFFGGFSRSGHSGRDKRAERPIGPFPSTITGGLRPSDSPPVRKGPGYSARFWTGSCRPGTRGAEPKTGDTDGPSAVSSAFDLVATWVAKGTRLHSVTGPCTAQPGPRT